MKHHIILDISRSLDCAGKRVLTGIDRVERAYHRWALSQEKFEPLFLIYFAGIPFLLDRKGGKAMLARFETSRFLRSISPLQIINDGLDLFPLHAKTKRAGRLGRLLSSSGATPENTTYLNVGHTGVFGNTLKSLKNWGSLRIVLMIHDLIPHDFPEYTRPAGFKWFERKLKTIKQYGDVYIVISDDTRARLTGYLGPDNDRPFITASPGLEEFWINQEPAAPVDDDPYFVFVSTIEPRKNHLLLLHIWRRFHERLGEQAPRLHIVGGRGWENENILDLLDRCPGVRALVTEHNKMQDDELISLLAGARATLFPSFAEGFGLPVAESLAMGVPVIAADLPALRQAGGSAPEYIDPLDGPAWSQAVLDYSDIGHQTRIDQIERIKNFSPPTWKSHFNIVETLLLDTALNSQE